MQLRGSGIPPSSDRVVAVVRNSGRGRAGGVPTQGRYYVACVVREGQIIAGAKYATREEALQAGV
jgi:ketosteroid isomerase-like protein